MDQGLNTHLKEKFKSKYEFKIICSERHNLFGVILESLSPYNPAISGLFAVCRHKCFRLRLKL